MMVKDIMNSDYIKVSPFTGGKVKIVDSESTVTFRGEKITAPRKFYRCIDTGHEFTDAKLDGDFMWAVFRNYCDKKYQNFTEILEQEVEAISKKYRQINDESSVPVLEPQNNQSAKNADNKPHGISVKKLVIKSSADNLNENGYVHKKEAVDNALEKWKENEFKNETLELLHRATKEYTYKEIMSPMNYVGGKKKLLPYILPLFPKTNNFLDLFCGGATVGINSQSECIWFNDIIKPIIDMYKYMAETPINTCLEYIDSVIDEWELTQENEEAYYAFREKYNNTPEELRHPLDMFVLRAYSFNNQIRFNEKKHTFNMPFGKNRSSFNNKMRENLIEFMTAIQGKQCVFTSYDFRELSMNYVPGFENHKDTFVYADPPYLVSEATYNSTWTEETEQELLDFLRDLDLKGYKFALSNVLENKGQRNVILENWVNKYNYNIIHLKKSYANSSYHRKNKESKTDEVLITNYPTLDV